MKSIGGVAVLQAHDSLNNHPDNLFSSPKKSYANSPSPTPNFAHRRRRRPPDLKMLSRQMKNHKTEFFAGSAFVESPPPSSVPIPAFFSKNFSSAVTDASDHDHDRTTELRRILGLSMS